MLNQNSIVVQNLISQQQGFNPYNGYVPQQNYYPQQQSYYQQQLPNYNPYQMNTNNSYDDPLYNWGEYYDPMPNTVINEGRGINIQANQVPTNNYQYNSYYNNMAFSGYTNPILMRNQIEADKIKQREFAIQQGKIWKLLFKNDPNIDIDKDVKFIESLYYSEPVKEDIPIKEKIYREKNKYFGELEYKLEYYRANNIPIMDERYITNCKLASYYNHITDVIGNPDECGMYEYFTEVYPELYHEELDWKCERERRNLKNRYNSKEFNKYIDEESKDKTDSYYYKLMESFSDNGVSISNGDGLIMTPDQMEIKLPSRLIKNRQDKYYEQRKKFYDSVFKKEV